MKKKQLSADVINGVTVQKLSLNHDDVVIFHVDVGNMSAPSAEEYLMRLKRKFDEAKPFENETMWFAHRPGKKIEDGTHVSVISNLCKQCLKCIGDKNEE